MLKVICDLVVKMKRKVVAVHICRWSSSAVSL